MPRLDLTEQRAAELYASSWPAVVNVAARRLGNLEEAEAVAQEALLRALDTLQHEEVHHFRALAMRIALNLIIDTQRRGEWRSPREDPELLVDPTPLFEGGEIDAQKSLAQIREALERLDDEQRELIDMKYVQGLSFAQIAQRLGMSKNGVFARHERALDRLRVLLAPREPNTPARKRT